LRYLYNDDVGSGYGANVTRVSGLTTKHAEVQFHRENLHASIDIVAIQVMTYVAKQWRALPSSSPTLRSGLAQR
jgi:hypothetical protein